MDEDLKIRKISEKKVSQMTKNISWMFGVVGFTILLSQGIPLLNSYVQGKIQVEKQELMKDPLPQSYKEYIENEFAYYDPGKSYFENLSKNADSLQYQGIFTYDPTTKTSKEIIVDRNYNKNMFISIPKIEINNIRITPNVESANESVYDKYLKFGLAHFKGTPLPGDGGNSFIYGHSAVQSFFSKHSNLPETIFTKLENIDIGDIVEITREEEIYKYIVRNKKIVSPEDFSILKTQGDKETVTLMTCWPLGAGIKRLVVVAERI
jgi:LPXTG-site transpeptidase (sortase) family protein